MAFQNFTSIQIVTCPGCSGIGCLECANFGVYGLSGDKTLTFNLPQFLDLKKRKSLKTAFLVKRTLLVIVALVFVGFIWSMIGKI